MLEGAGNDSPRVGTRSEVLSRLLVCTGIILVVDIPLGRADSRRDWWPISCWDWNREWLVPCWHDSESRRSLHDVDCCKLENSCFGVGALP